MKRSFICLISVFLSFSAIAQESLPIKLDVVTSLPISSLGIPGGDTLTFTKVLCDVTSKKGYNYIVMAQKKNGGEIYRLDLGKMSKLSLQCRPSNKDEYWNFYSIQQTLPSLAKMRKAYEYRAQAENSANQYVNILKDSGLIIEDPYLSSYLNSLLVKINPSQRLDFFNYNTRAYIVKDDEPNAGIFPNGALLINAGILARIHTEDELVALLCHEVNHFVGNHYLSNIAKAQKRATAGLIGSTILGAAAGVLTGSASVGLKATSVALDISNELNELITAMGLAFDQTQEKECDRAAVKLLPMLGYDVNGMATCIDKIGDYYMEEGNLTAYYKSGSHPKIEDRIAATGVPYERRDSTFEKKMASCVSYVAKVLYDKGRYRQALEFANRNITNNVGRSIDYYIKGECLLATNDTEESNREAKESLLLAKESYTNKSATMKALIISNMRLGNKDEANVLLKEFLSLNPITEEERAWGENMIQNLSF